MRTKQESIKGLLDAIDAQKSSRDFNILNDLKMLTDRYPRTAKRDYLHLLRSLTDKYSIDEYAAVHAALLRKCQEGDLAAIKLHHEMQKNDLAAGEEVQIVDDI